MQQRIASLFPLAESPDNSLKRRTLVCYVSLLFLLGSHMFLLIPPGLRETADRWNWDLAPVAAANVILIAGWGIAWILARRRLVVVSAILLASTLLEGTFFVWGSGWDSPQGLILLCVCIVLASLLLSTRAAAAVAALTLGISLASLLHDFDDLSTGAQTEHTIAFVVTIMGMLLLGAVAVLTARSSDQVITQSPADNAMHLMAEIIDELAQHLFSRQELDTVLLHTAEQLQQRLSFVYHIGIYLIDPDVAYASLRASTGEVGERLLAKEYRLEIGGLSPVGHATLTHEPLLIADMARDPIYRPQELLPKTRSELAIPFVAGDRVIGALDVQSAQADAFDPLTVVLLRAIAAQIAMTVDGLQLHETTQRGKRENQALYEQTQANLHEIRRLNYLLTGRAWADYVRLQPEATAMTLDLESDQTFTETDWTPALKQALGERRAITTLVDGRRIVAFPIAVRDEVIGAMEFELDPETDVPDNDFELISTVGQRLGLAIENRRLFDETQRIAQREALINDIGAQLQGATAVDAIIQHAARHLQQALAAQQVRIRIGIQPERTQQAGQEKTEA